jgi:SSS family solute:Na+ symporter
MVIMALIGLRGQAWMNVIHFVVIIITFVIVTVAAVGAAGGLNNLIAAVPATHLDFWQMGGPTTFAYVASSSGIKLISLTAIVAMFAARSERDAKIGAISTGFIILAFTVMPVLIGLSAKVLIPGIASKEAMWQMGEYLGGTMPAIVSIGVVAAIVSTTPGVLLSLGALVSRDCFRLWKPTCSEAEQINACRIGIVVIAVVGATVAYLLTKTSTIMGVVVQIVEVRTVIVIPLLVSVVWRRINSTAAFWTVISGVTAGIIWLFVGSHDIEPFWPAVGVGTFVMVVVSFFKKPLPYRGTEGLALEKGDAGGES